MIRTLTVAALACLIIPVAAHSSCSVAELGYQLKWSDQTWPTSSINETYTLYRTSYPGMDPVDVSLLYDAGTTTPTSGHPTTNTSRSGGTSDTSLEIVQTTGSLDASTVTISFSAPVSSLSFDIFDIDMDVTDAEELLSIAGSSTDGSVSPDITTPYDTTPGSPGEASTIASISGGTVTAKSSTAANASDAGNIIVTFPQDVDEVVITLQNSGTEEGEIGVALHNLEFCTDGVANIQIEKNITIFDETPETCHIIPGEPNLDAAVAIPGSCIQYEVNVENIGTGQANALTLSDTLPAYFMFSAADRSDFGEDDVDFGFVTPLADADCSLTPCDILLQNATLEPGATGVLVVRGIIK